MSRGRPGRMRLFTRLRLGGPRRQSIVEVEVPAGVEVYSFTFG